MTSRKYFLSISAMMLVLFFMFMFSEIVKTADRNYNENKYAKVTPIVHKENRQDAEAVSVAYVGENKSVGNSVSAWCRYTKKTLVEDKASVIVVDSKSLTKDIISQLNKEAENGAVLIFAGFPDLDLLENNATLKNLLGVSEVKEHSTRLEGAYLYSGFLLGGEKVYLAETKNDSEYQDFTQNIPWIELGKGTKTYMIGLTGSSIVEKNNKKELGVVQADSPVLIWRAVTGNTVAFVIYDDFVDDSSIQGVLEACIYESADFDFYPVVNASVYTVADFALLSEENSEVIMGLYSRTTQSLVKEIVWPKLLSMSKRDNIVFSCYFNTRLNKDTEDPSWDNYEFFLRELAQISSEAGVSGNSINDTLDHKLAEDLDFYDSNGGTYKATSLYIKSLKSGDVKSIADSSSKIYSLIVKEKGDCDYIDAAGNLVINAVTQDSSRYSYKADFTYRSLMTAIGYSNVLIDIERIMQPESSADEWQNYSEEISSNLSDYWCDLSPFSNVTASEAANRSAAFLKNTAICTKKDRYITITGSEAGYFILRTHGEKITYIENASFTFLEEGAYLITVTNSETVKITVE